ncbi:hypothetical protein A2Y99_03455 [Candidatus Gottesmanbacteria bacterium RBG_13_37_7]|uniref:Pilus assembly protein PilO n=1 Tax=Candidatus Gottesmanbacteria bacterium RBG_13_37_7 TaxID=1798369 RepID=A0A1F5YJ91_9BACT|nr:MAG: hypothetical protein A2Y99_03455 [Candidatus Gottesmanbacteria bacterium RBG_13_37_7]
MSSSILRRIYLVQAYKKLIPVIKHKKTFSYFTITLSFFALSFFGLFAIRPTLITAFSLVKKVSDLRQLNIEYENKIQNVIKAQSEYEKIRNDIPLVLSAIPQNASFNSLARNLEKFATISGITILQLQINSVPVSQSLHQNVFKEYNFNLTALGNYPALTSYLQHIINWKRIVNIKNLELIHGSSSMSGDLRISIKGATYYEP